MNSQYFKLFYWNFSPQVAWPRQFIFYGSPLVNGFALQKPLPYSKCTQTILMESFLVPLHSSLFYSEYVFQTTSYLKAQFWNCWILAYHTNPWASCSANITDRSYAMDDSWQLSTYSALSDFFFFPKNLINSHKFIYSHRQVSNHNSLLWLLATDP